MPGSTLLLFFPSAPSTPSTPSTGDAGATQFVGPFGWSFLFNASATTTTYTFKEAIVTAILADATITDLIGDGIEPQRTSQPETLPAITYAVTRDWGTDLDGRDGSVKARVTFTAHASTLSACESILQAVADVLGDLRQATLSGVTIYASWLEDDPDSYDWPDDASDDGTFTDALTISFLYLNP